MDNVGVNADYVRTEELIILPGTQVNRGFGPISQEPWYDFSN